MMIRRVALPISDLAQHLEDVTAIAGALAQRRGITHVDVNPRTETAYVEYDPTRGGLLDLIATVENMGFQPGAPSLLNAPLH